MRFLLAVLLMAIHVHVPRVVTTAAGSLQVDVVRLAGGASVQPGGGAFVAELGTVSSNVRATADGVAIEHLSNSYVVVTTIGLRVEGTGADTASVQAFVDSIAPRLVVRIDGMPLSQVPRTIASRVQVGTVTRHRLEVEIPNNLDPSLVPSELPLEFGATPE